MRLSKKNPSSRREQRVPVQWHDCAWMPRIVVRFSFVPRRSIKNVRQISALRMGGVHLYLKPMKIIPLLSRRSRAFTLVELLTVIAIIALLAALLLPVLAAVKKHALIAQAKMQISDIDTAIEKYHSDYSRYPVSSPAQNAAVKYSSVNGDFTYGCPSLSANTFSPGYRATNDEVMAILMDITTYPSTTTPTANKNHQKNPQRNVYLSAKMSTDTNVEKAVVGPDLVYRDPWGNPYVITMDLNEDGQCQDAFYSLASVSQVNASGGIGYFGLVNQGLVNPTPGQKINRDAFQYHGGVMVWSAGPDKQITQGPANQGVNKDNILSWQ